MKPTRRIGWTLGVVVLISTLSGCATVAVSHLGSTRHHRVRSIEEVKRAALSPENLVLELETSSAKSDAFSKHRLVLPLKHDEWLTETEKQRESSLLNHLDAVEVWHLTPGLFKESSGATESTIDVEVRSVVVDDLRTLGELAAPEADVTVLSVVYRAVDAPPEFEMPNEESHAHTGPLLAVVWRRDAANPRKPLVVAGFYERYRRPGWFALTPIAVGVDIVTLPLQFVVIVLAIASDGC